MTGTYTSTDVSNAISHVVDNRDTPSNWSDGVAPGFGLTEYSCGNSRSRKPSRTL
jgi:hypothetical protein